MDTVDANRALGFPDDCREYTSVHNILKELGVKSIRLMVSGPNVWIETCIKPIMCRLTWHCRRHNCERARSS